MLTEQQAIRLMDECLDNQISEEDGAQLLLFLQDHPEFTRDVYDNLYLDSLLRQRCDDLGDELDSTSASEEPGRLLEKIETNHLPQWFDDLERLAAETPASPTRRPVAMPDVSTRPRFSFFSIPGVKLLYRSRKWFLYLGYTLFFLFGAYGVYLEILASRGAPTVAHLTGFDDVVWEGDVIPIELGDPIKRRPLRIRSGSLSLKTLTGVDIVLEGPAEFRIKSQSNWHLSYGYLSANVPPQKQKIRLKTGQMAIDILGTEFWVKATEDKSEVHLLQGKLSLHGNSIRSQILNAGDAFSMSTIGETKLFKSLSNQLLRADDLFTRAERKLQLRREKTLQAVNREPSLLLYFDFQEFGRTLPNLAAHGQPLLDSARIEGCSQISGPATGEKAIAFRRHADRMLLELSKPLESFTLFTRVKVDSEVKHRCALLISEDSAPGSLQWMIASEGIPVLNISKGKDDTFENFSAPKVFTGQNLRRWKAMAVVYDAMGKKVDWYIDGALVSSSKIDQPTPVTLHRGMIGNWTRGRGTLPPGAGFGLAELRLYQRALSEEEIVQLNDR